LWDKYTKIEAGDNLLVRSRNNVSAGSDRRLPAGFPLELVQVFQNALAPSELFHPPKIEPPFLPHVDSQRIVDRRP